MNESPFSVSIENIKTLDDLEAVKIFKLLLNAEAVHYNFPLSQLQISENIKASDEGIDAIIRSNENKNFGDVLKEGNVIYQIKADNSFANLASMTIINELLVEKINKKNFEKLTDDSLKKLIKPKLLEHVAKGGYFILVSFRTDSVGDKKQQAIDLIKNIFERCGCKAPKIDIFDATNLQGFTNQHISVVNSIIPIPDVDSVDNMLKQENLNNTFYENDEIKEVAVQVKNFIENKDNCRHLRILAEPGIGKTKAILEFCKEYNSAVIYVENADKFDDSEFYSYLKKSSRQNFTLIIDECNSNNARTFWDKLKVRLPDLKLITIYNELENYSYDAETKIIEYPRLHDEDFAEILIQNYGVEKAAASHIASLCEGYPRLAHYIGKNYKNNRTLLDKLESVLNGVVLVGENNDSVKSNILCVLRFLSLFKKFGCSEIYQNEKIYIFNLIRSEIPDLTLIQFQDIVDNLKSKKILQQEYTLYISPKILHIWFYKEFWRNQERKNLILNDIDNMPEQLKTWFFEMFEYAQDLPIDIPNELLIKFEKEDFLSKQRTNFFLNLTKANPQEALNTLLRIFKDATDDDFKNIIDGRMDLVWAMQYILFDKELFKQGIKLLYRLAVNETETIYSNNATGILKQLFQIALPGTEASLKQRKEILQEFYQNMETNIELELLTDVLNSALHTGHFSRMGGVEQQGFEIKKDYIPESYNEIFEYYKFILDTLLDSAKTKNNRKAIDVILDHFIPLARYSKETCNIMLSMVTEIQEHKLIAPQILYQELTKIIKLLKYKNNENIKNIVDFLENVKNQLEQLSPAVQIETLFNIDSWNIIEPEDNHFETFINIIANAYKKFSKDMLIEEKLNFIKNCIQNKYKNDFYFGVAIVRTDCWREISDEILSYYINSDNSENLFLVGCLSEIYKNSEEDYDKSIKKIYDSSCYNLVVNIMTQCYKTELASELAIDCIITHKVSPEKLKKFIWDVDKIPQNLLKDLLLFSINENNPIIIKSILDILYHSKEIWIGNNDLIYEILMSVIEKNNNGATANIDDDYIWSSVLSKFIKQTTQNEQIFNLFNNFIYYITHKKGYYFLSDHVKNVLNLVLEIDPHRSWVILSQYLSPETIAFSPIKEWLRGDDNFDHDIDGVMGKFDQNDIYKWIDDDLEERLRLIAYSCPKDLFKNGVVMKSLIKKYGNSPNLYEYLITNFFNKGWTGKESENIKKELDLIGQTKKEENNVYVLEFINKYEQILKNDLNRAILREEREGF